MSTEIATLVDSIRTAYMEPGADLAHLAIAFKVSCTQLKELVTFNGWDVERAQFIEELKQNTEEKLAVLRATRTVGATETLADTSDKLANAIDNSLEEVKNLPPKVAITSIERLAKAHANNVSVVARILALSAPTQRLEIEHSGDISFMGGGGPRLPQAIDATVIKDERL